jgi:hypothetical protein
MMDQQTSTSTETTTPAASTAEKPKIPSSNTSLSSFPLEDIEDVDIESSKEGEAMKHASEESDILFDSSLESAGNSAHTSWSEGSTGLMSDEIEDEDQWNDWGNERLTLEELELEERERSLEGDVDEDGDDEDAGALPSDAEVESNLSETDPATSEDLNYRDGDLHLLDGDSGVESNYSPSNYSFSDSQVSDSDNEYAARLEDMMLGSKSANSEGAHRTSIRIYDSTRLERIPVFHYTLFIKRTLFDSPPAFHPSKPLLVWPLGDGEILFANYKANTYFTRELCRSQFRGCHIFIKTHFSRIGEYLHFAALEARETDAENGKPRVVLLSLQVSTHRLSLRKTTSSPPRLVFRTIVDLGYTPTITVSNLPYFVSWTDKELYITRRSEKLDVIRIPLFHSSTTNSAMIPSICHLKDSIFLPRSSALRGMHFFPAEETLTVPSKKDKKPAALILRSHCSIPSQEVVIPKHTISPPLVVYLHEDADLGGWTCRANSEADSKQRVSNSCGRLKGKFESFDRTEDCDIVPYLF